MMGVFTTTTRNRLCRLPLFLAVLLVTLTSVCSQSCPSGWTQRSGTYDCYVFVVQTMPWDQARAFCVEYEGDLVSADKPGENEWLRTELSMGDYWIGLSDPDGLLKYAWSDGSRYDSSTSNWDFMEPSHRKGTTTCVVMSSTTGLWSDNSCGESNPFICERSLTDPIKCDESNGWVSKNKRCYYAATRWLTWDDAQANCEQNDANLMDIKDDTEQAILAELVKTAESTLWIGYKTVNGQDHFTWSSGATWTYTHWGQSQPQNFSSQMCTDVEYTGEATGKWTTENCFYARRFVCEKPEGMCYPGWKIHSGSCYQLAAYEPTTWIEAKHQCEAQGALLLTVKSSTEQDFINQQLPSLSQSGIENIWLGVSDTVEDGKIAWVDGTDLGPTDYQNWPSHKTPANRQNENQCGSIYSESSIGQWDYGDCFNMFNYVCKVAEGAPLTPVDPDDPIGHCPVDWYYYNKFCYYMNDTGVPYDEAEQTCEAAGGHLTSIHSAEEMSFITIRLGYSDYFIGLNDRDKEDTYVWTDGTIFDYSNWDLNEPNNQNGEDCVHLRGPYTTPAGVWNDIHCYAQYAFVCKRPADSTTPPPPTNPPILDCYEPTIPYHDKAQLTVNGKVCLYWSDMTDRPYNPDNYPGADLTENYCRNPNHAPAPWCYVDDGLETCDITQCNAPQDCYEGDGYTYRGKASQTENGDTCYDWASLDSRAGYRPIEYPEEGLEGNYCRNPSGASYGPWCYYGNWTWGYFAAACGVQKCNTTGCYEGSGTAYRGSASKAEDGSKCKKWADATNMPYNPNTCPNSGLDHNYCRNPSREEKPWCYVSGNSSNLVEQPCAVPHCTTEVGCYVGRGTSYRGNANYVSIGRTCLDWVNFIDEFYPDPLNEFTMIAYHAIGQTTEWMQGFSVQECAHRCLTDPNHFCQSFNYRQGSGGSDTHCYLSVFNQDDGPLRSDRSQNYYERNQTYGLENNFCRNPNGAVAPWCYYHDPIYNDTAWAFCQVPECNPEDVGCYNPLDNGASYRGGARTTASGHICVEWKDTFYTPDRYPNAGLEENFCRNPTVFTDKPFCYYHGTHGLSREDCDIPQCDIKTVCGDGIDWIADPAEEWCYKINQDSSSNFDDAHNNCIDDGGDLTSIASASESSYLSGLISGTSVTGFWIGATDLNQEAGWTWTDGSAFAYLNWLSGQPDNLHGTEQCALMSANNGQWTDENCDRQFPRICKKRSDKQRTTLAPTTQAPGSRCPTDWAGYGSHCYLVQKDLVDWKTARSACQDLDASLASIHSLGEMQHVANLLAEASRQYYFFGANDIQQQGKWTYGNGSDDTPLSYTKWADGQPDNFGGSGEDCACMLYSWDWQWNDAECLSKYQFVCENENNGGDGSLGRYSAHRESMTFADAQAHCIKYDGTLATIANEDDMNTMSTLLTSMYNPFDPDIFWFGANDITTEGTWMMGGDPQSTVRQTYKNWHQGEPNNYKSDGEHCGLMAPVDELANQFTEFQWYDWGCSNAERFICEDIDSKSDYMGSGGHPYTAVNEALTWNEASTYCKSKGGRLAQIRMMYDQSNIEYMLYDNRQKLLSSVGAWLGLNDISHHMTFEWSDGSKVTYTNWNTGEPDDFSNAQDCVFAYSKSGTDSTGRTYRAGKWADYECEAEDYGYVCMKGKGNFGPSEIPPPEYDCPMGWTGSEMYCYLILETQLSWDKAKEECASNENTSIAYIPNYQEQLFLGDALSDRTGLYWIGLNDRSLEGVYHWETGQPVTYTAWDVNQPGNAHHECVAISAGQDSLWDDQSCDSRYSAICQKQRYPGVKPELPPTPSPTGSCPSDWVGFRSYCYLIVRETNETTRKNYNNALFDCYYKIGFAVSNLASLHSPGEEQFIRDQVASLSPSVDKDEGFWIGMSDWANGYLHWEDQTPLQYVNWAPGMPEERPMDDDMGLEIFPGENGGGWQFITVQARRSWICKAPRGSQGVTTMPPVSPVKSQKCGDNWEMWDYYAEIDTCYLFKGSAEQNRTMWSDAVISCNKEGGNLVSIHSPAENNFVHGLAKLNFINTMWLGMFDFDTRGGFLWSDGSPADYFNWDVHEPGNGVTSCITMNVETGGWKLTECDSQVPYMCKKTPDNDNYTPAPTERAGGYCPKNWFTWGNKCLQFQDHADSWLDARNHCQVLGGDLASIRDKTEEAFIVTLLETIPDPVWIGLNDIHHEGLFTWSDGVKVYYTNWATNEPNNKENVENCVHMYGSNSASIPGTWNDAECTQLYRSLCQIPRDPTGTPVGPTLSLCGSYKHYANSCYKIINGSLTRAEAKTQCESDGLGQLASINSIYEQKEIELMLRAAGLSRRVYIGLTYGNHTYRWDDGWPMMYTNWAHGQPSLGPLETCTALSEAENGKWDDVMCNNTFGAICKYTFDVKPVQPTLSPEDCPGKGWSVHGSACYRAHVEDEFIIEWSAAVYACSLDGAHLVSLHSMEERDFVLSLITRDIYSVWIGLNSVGNIGFQWDDNSPYEYNSWAPGEPSGKNGDEQDEECVQMFTSGGHRGQWNDLYCLEKWPFVCKFTKSGSVIPTKPPGIPDNNGGLSIGAIIGITLGSVAFITIIGVLIIMLRRQNRMTAYFRSVAGLEVAPEELFNEEPHSESVRGLGRTNSFDDAMLSVN